MVVHIQAKLLVPLPPLVTRTELEAAYMERIALRQLRPFDFDWKTGVDLLASNKPETAAAAVAAVVTRACYLGTLLQEFGERVADDGVWDTAGRQAKKKNRPSEP